MTKNVFFLIVAFILGTIAASLYFWYAKPCIPITEGNYVMGDYLIFHDEDNGTRILEKTDFGISSLVFIPGNKYHELLTQMTNPEILEYEGGEIIFMRGVHFDKDSIDITPKFYRIVENQLLELTVSNK